jgi:hypothetical protein
MKARFLQLRNTHVVVAMMMLCFGLSTSAAWAQDVHPGHDSAENPVVALQQLDSSVRDLQNAAAQSNQAKSEAALTKVDSAFQHVQAQDPENSLKGH